MLARELRNSRTMTVEQILGWWLACTVYPHAAWRVLRPWGRAFLIGTYVGVGYFAALLILLAG